MAKSISKFDWLSYLLGQYGTGNITTEEFRRRINERGYTSEDIDRWCDEFYQLEASKERADAARQEGTERATATGDARGAGRQEQEGDRQERQGDQQGVRRQGPAAPEQDARQENGRGLYQGEAGADRPIITLSAQWLAKAREVGAARQAYAESQDYENYGTSDAGEERNHVAGAISECAVAKHFNLPWKPHVGTTTGIDVGGLIEVRTRIIPGTGTDLAIRPDDKDDKPYVHTHVYADNRVRLIGWLYSKDGKHGNNGGVWNAGRAVWFVPPPYRSIAELEELLQ